MSATECLRVAKDRAGPAQDELLAEVARRIRQEVETQAASHRWSFALPHAFVEDCALKAAAAVLDLLEREDETDP